MIQFSVSKIFVDLRPIVSVAKEDQSFVYLSISAERSKIITGQNVVLKYFSLTEQNAFCSFVYLSISAIRSKIMTGGGARYKGRNQSAFLRESISFFT